MKYRCYPQVRQTPTDEVTVTKEVETVANTQDIDKPQGYKYDELYDYDHYETDVSVLPDNKTVVKIYLKRKQFEIKFYNSDKTTPITVDGITSIVAR